jgi:5-methylcytosine-specific restriction endonuclease McrA
MHRTRSPSSRNASSSKWVGEIRPAALERAGHVCEHCGTTADLDVHHCDLNPDNNHPENLIVLCRSCHAEVHRQRSATWQTA